MSTNNVQTKVTGILDTSPAQLNTWQYLNGKPFVTVSVLPTYETGCDFGPDSTDDNIPSSTGGQAEANNWMFSQGGGLAVLVNNQELVITPSPINTFITASQIGSGESFEGVSQIIAGTGITINPTSGSGVVTINSTAVNGVSQIIAGTNVTINPVSGSGVVTINSAGSPGPSGVAGPAGGTTTVARTVNNQISSLSQVTLLTGAPNTLSNVLCVGSVSTNTSVAPSGPISLGIAWNDAYTSNAQSYPWLSSYWMLPSGITLLNPLNLSVASGVTITLTATASVIDAFSVSCSMIQL